MPGLGLTEVVRRVAAALATAALAGALVGTAAGHGGAERRAGTIAFLRYPPGAWVADVGGPSLFVIQADGTGLRRLTSPDSRVFAHSWSPDGSRIAYTDRRSLWLVRPDGTGRVRLFSGLRLRTLLPTWSPDGKAIAVLAEDAESGIAEIYVVPARGGAPRRLGVGDVRDPSWSPRGDEIAYASPKGDIWAVRSDGSHARLVADHPSADCFLPAWSARGRQLACAGGDSTGRYASIYVVNADGSGLRRLTSHAYNEYGFSWSPDGRRILYGREHREGIYVIGADGRNNRRVTTDSPAPVAWGALTWSPDGRSIAYATDRTGSGDIYVIDADGRGKARLTRSAEIDVDPSWSAG